MSSKQGMVVRLHPGVPKGSSPLAGTKKGKIMNLYNYYEEYKEKQRIRDDLDDSIARTWDKIEELELESGNWMKFDIEIFLRGSIHKLSYVLQKSNLSDEEIEEHIKDYVDSWLHSNWIYPDSYSVEYERS